MPRAKIKPKPIVLLDTVLTEFHASTIISKPNRRRYGVAMSLLKKYTVETTGKEWLPLAEYDLRFLTRFTVWLRQQKKLMGGKARKETNEPLSDRTMELYMANLKTVMKFAFLNDYVESDPFSKYDMNKLRSVVKMTADMLDRKISKSDLRRIEATSLEDPILERARLLFLFQRWTGMAYSDLAHQDIKKCVRTMEGQPTILYNRMKNGQLAIVPLFEETGFLLKRLEGVVNPGSYTFYRTRLLEVFAKFGLNTDNLGTHTGRHVFGSEMLEMGLPMESVSRMMGHGSVRETEKVYAKINATKIYADLDKAKANPWSELAERFMNAPEHTTEQVTEYRRLMGIVEKS